jgi:hypothetical protein
LGLISFKEVKLCFFFKNDIWGVPLMGVYFMRALDGLFHGNPNKKWMRTGGTPIFGNLHIYIYMIMIIIMIMVMMMMIWD